MAKISDGVSRRAFGLMLASVPLMNSPLVAQAAWPTKPVRVLVPFGAGGVADITARIVTERLGDKLGQRFVIENQPGPGGINAARATLAGGNDGHTLALSVNMFKDLRFDPVKDFVPISTLGFFDFILATNGASRYKTLKDFIDYGKANPGAMNVGTVIVGSTQNLSAELLKTATGIDHFLAVTYRTVGCIYFATLRNHFRSGGGSRRVQLRRCV